MFSRRKFLLGGGAALATASACGCAGFHESNQVEVKRVEIHLERLPEAFDGFTIAQLSDFHYEDRFTAVPIRKAVELVNGLNPDLIVLTGDFVTVPLIEYDSHNYRQSGQSAAPCAAILAQLKAPMGTFAVLGNHDVTAGEPLVKAALEAHHIPVIENRSLPLEQSSGRIWLAGIDDALDGTPDLGRALAKIPAGEATILLAHEPDIADEVSTTTVDLQLSGHSHGGQIWIPGLGAPWLPPLGRKYPRGLRRIGRLTLYTNIGIGTIRAPIRLNSTPEVTLFSLRAGPRRQAQAIQNDPNRL